MVIGFAEIAAWLLQALGLTSAALTIIQFVSSALGWDQSQGTFQEQINLLKGNDGYIRADIATLSADLAALVASQSTDKSDILTAVNDTQRADTAVLLPSAPTGYGGLSAGATGSAVWDALGAVRGYDFGYMVESLWEGFRNIEKTGSYLARRNPYFSVSGPWSSFSHSSPDYNEMPNFDVSLITPTSTVLGILTASNPGLTWFADPDGQHQSTFWTVLGNYEFHCLVDDAMLYLLKQGVIGPVTNVSAPLWPGLAAATLSTPVAISSGLTITELMDGVIVNLSGVPTRANFWQFDDKPSYRNIGGLSFFNDDGELEVVQILGFEQAIYTPKTMQHAAGVKLRADPGVSGTVTPWIISP